jgi:predicted SAM-dependent methyltransferase
MSQQAKRSTKEETKREIKLHLGCGDKEIPGFIHIDINDFPHIDYRKSVEDLTIFDDRIVDVIYSSHTLEYFDRFRVRDVLKEWYRVLKKGGILRVAVPDFEGIVRVYKKYGDIEHQGILGPLYGRWEYNDEGGQTHVMYHKTVYDFKSLKGVLTDSGFKRIERYEPRETIHRDYDDFSQAYIPHMDRAKGIPISLNVMAVK